MKLLSPARWRSVPFRSLHRLPAAPGLYAIRFTLWPFSRTLYIGMSSDIHQRWTAVGGRRHHRYWQASVVPCCRVAYFEARAYKRLEGEYIKRFDPPWNWSNKPWWAEQDNPILGKFGALGWWLKTSWREVVVIWLAAVCLGLVAFNFLGV